MAKMPAKPAQPVPGVDVDKPGQENVSPTPPTSGDDDTRSMADKNAEYNVRESAGIPGPGDIASARPAENAPARPPQTEQESRKLARERQAAGGDAANAGPGVEAHQAAVREEEVQGDPRDLPRRLPANVNRPRAEDAARGKGGKPLPLNYLVGPLRGEMPQDEGELDNAFESCQEAIDYFYHQPVPPQHVLEKVQREPLSKEKLAQRFEQAGSGPHGMASVQESGVVILPMLVDVQRKLIEQKRVLAQKRAQSRE